MPTQETINDTVRVAMGNEINPDDTVDRSRTRLEEMRGKDIVATARQGADLYEEDEARAVFSDNDRLAALVATKLGADLLLIRVLGARQRYVVEKVSPNDGEGERFAVDFNYRADSGDLRLESIALPPASRTLVAIFVDSAVAVAAIP